MKKDIDLMDEENQSLNARRKSGVKRSRKSSRRSGRKSGCEALT